MTAPPTSKAPASGDRSFQFRCDQPTRVVRFPVPPSPSERVAVYVNDLEEPAGLWLIEGDQVVWPEPVVEAGDLVRIVFRVGA